MSFNIINLPDWLRYCTSNLLLSGITPGPKEQTGDQIQRFMQVFVNEDGFLVCTEKYPEGRHVHVVLVGVICDKPAAHKLGGFSSHSHSFFCHWCWISLSEKQTVAAFQCDACKPRTHEEQLALMKRYLALQNKAQHKAFVTTYATQWCELACLPYFDVCRMIVIDPMHNLLLGLVKTHFYNIWIQLNVLHKNKELRHFHDILVQLNIPPFLGHLPAMMGEPAGGSLTADQWLIATTIVCPIIVPQIWDEYCTDQATVPIVLAWRVEKLAEDIEAKKAAAAAACKAAAEARKAKELLAKQATQASSVVRPHSTRKHKQTEKAQYVPEPEPNGMDNIMDAGEIEGASKDEYDEEIPPKHLRTGDPNSENDADPALPNIHPNDPANFFKLSAALQLILAQKTCNQDIEEADVLLQQYDLELISLYGPSVLKPNHHYATHTAACMHDFGPLHCFWTFLFERINKMMQVCLNTGPKTPISESIVAMYKATADNQGTVQALAQESIEAYEDGGIALQLSPHSQSVKLPMDVYHSLLRYLQVHFPHSHLRSYFSLGDSDSLALEPCATIFDYVIVSQRRYWSLSRATNGNANSLVAVCMGPGEVSIGELMDIIVIQQDKLGIQPLGHM
ncbi:hypothetical protein EV421DRAFT_1911298 [Armillaria borealis]|uniref:Uncharacterized protein n=1 Tax=Armillaria borealis TaxID=47425 RepID=A0AA39MFK7_9AGAR|nr:hypothetical protein EV421DRAFT_1911298 [Armillaria borealis]